MGVLCRAPIENIKRNYQRPLSSVSHGNLHQDDRITLWHVKFFYSNRVGGFSLQSEFLGRCLEPADNAGNAISRWILNNNGKPTKAEIANPIEIEKRESFDKIVCLLLGISAEPPTADIPDITPYYKDEEIIPYKIPEVDSLKTTTSTPALDYFYLRAESVYKLLELWKGHWILLKTTKELDKRTPC